ncbi:MAG: hypothetical protein LC808_24950 [Actinobacteria bacterium]|nr:hypothetical protein [Actinomycetota bacterium]
MGLRILGIDGTAQPSSMTCPKVNKDTGEIVNASRVTCRTGGYRVKGDEKVHGFAAVPLHCINELPWAYAHGPVNMEERAAAYRTVEDFRDNVLPYTGPRLAGIFTGDTNFHDQVLPPETLREVMLRAAEHWGRPPSVAEFAWWRERELELARAQGDPAPHLPSDNAYRRRYVTWEGALLHFGFTADEVAIRLERGEQPRRHDPDAYLPDGLPDAELSALIAVDELPMTAAAATRLRGAYGGLPRRTRYVLTVRLGLGGHTRLTLKQTGEPLGLSLDRIRQIQVLALNELCRAVAIKKGDEPRAVRNAVVEALRALARVPA